MEFHKCVCCRTFYNQGPVQHCICTPFDTDRWSGPSYKISQSWFRTADGKWNGIKCLCFVDNRCSRARQSLAPPMECLQELFPGGGGKLKTLKLKTFWRYEGCNTTIQVLKIRAVVLESGLGLESGLETFFYRLGLVLDSLVFGLGLVSDLVIGLAKCSSWSRPSPAIYAFFFSFKTKTRLFRKWVM